MTSIETGSHTPALTLLYLLKGLPALYRYVAPQDIHGRVKYAHHLQLLTLYGFLEEGIPVITTISHEQRAEDKDCDKPHDAA